ncbi:type 1 glutamine amidotransferase domain-containing protein [Allorhizocola rhizosphaerae]|uniref:type 1 glutamine amidotransferase domain-containing protein n=1 Tax=Allorhizocola rhizosphaerae TaxID=1872709 RepID=UPI000E3E1243|nr:type 1 glutamine amidotransferase domain-containing protein [Allorhizocola rhizosphaerae]
MRVLENKRVAFLATDGVEEIEYTEPREAVEKAGAMVELLSPKPGQIQAVQGMDKSKTYPVERPVKQASPDDYDALVIPGGVANPDKLRMDPDSVRFVRAMFDAGKPVAAICHGPWMLVEADVVDGRTVTSYPSLKRDLTNAGAQWVDEQVHVDRGLVTSRKPDDLPAFCDKVIEEIAEGIHRR